MKKIIPNQVVILGNKYKVRVKIDKVFKEEAIDGYITYKTNEIFIDKTLDKKNQFITFYHECIHGYLRESKVYLYLPFILNDLICEHLSYWIYGLIHEK